MFKLPYLQEILLYLLAVDVDLCTAGDLRDPSNGKHIRKPLTILSSSPNVVQQRSQYRCARNHEHQVIEGQVKVNGENMNRSKFTENYPQKFARRLAQMLCQVKTLKESPHRSQECQVFATEHPEAPVPKRARLSQTYRPKFSRARGVETLPWGKRQKLHGKSKPVDSTSQWSQVFERLHQILPRVGKRVVDDPQTQKIIHELIQDKHVRWIIACRGSSRTMAPPDNVIRGKAPYRKSMFTERGTGDMKAEEEWEPWENLAKRNLIRGSHPSRIKITVFASDWNKAALEPETAEQTPPPDTHSDVPAGDSVEPDNSEKNASVEKDEVPAPDPVPETAPCSRASHGMTPSQQEHLPNPLQSKKIKHSQLRSATCWSELTRTWDTLALNVLAPSCEVKDSVPR